MKTCRKCGLTKEASEFRTNLRTKDGLSSWCGACHTEATRRWRDANPEQVEAYNESRRKYPRIGSRRGEESPDRAQSGLR